MKYLNISLSPQKMSQGKRNREIEKVPYPPTRSEHSPHAFGMEMRQDHLTDEKLGKKNDDAGHGGFEYYAGECQWIGQMVKAECGHGDCTDYDPCPVEQIGDDDRLLVVEHQRVDNDIDQPEEKRNEIRRIGRYRMNTEMKHPSPQ